MKWPFSKTIETKSSVSEAQIMHGEQHDYAMQDWKAYSQEGYRLNPTIYRCINIIATNAATVTPIVKVNGERVENHPLELLLKRPNVDCGGVEFLVEAYSWALLTGNLFLEKLKVRNQVSELWNWEPYAFSIERSKINRRMPAAYVFGKGSASVRRWDVDPIKGTSEMMHWGLFNPSADEAFMGQSPLAAAASAGDQLNAANKWRYNLLKNDCRPSGVLSTDQPITTSDEKTLSQRLKEKAQSKFLLLGGGLKWQQLGLTPKDADHLAGSKFNKQEICEVFGVPIQILGIEGSQTFANMEQAILHLYNETVLPLVELYFSELNRWLAPEYGAGVEICYNENEIKALEPERKAALETRLNSDVLTINEKRDLLGYKALNEADADTLFIDPSKLPLGMDVFTSDEMATQEAAKSFMRMGLSRADAESKALDLFTERKCLAHKD